jgi:transposase
MNTTTVDTVGIDLAKERFFPVYPRRPRPGESPPATAPSQAVRMAGPTSRLGLVVAMETCGGAHYWARLSRQLGLEARLISAYLVWPFRKSARVKNDANDAEAIATAARQGNMRFVAIKSEDQQTRLANHALREGYKKERLAVTNRIRGLLMEFGIVIPQSQRALREALAGGAGKPGPAGWLQGVDS